MTNIKNTDSKKFTGVNPYDAEKEPVSYQWFEENRPLTQQKPVEQPEVKETAILNGEISNIVLDWCNETFKNPETLIEPLVEFVISWSDQRHAAEREVLVKRVHELEAAMQKIIVLKCSYFDNQISRIKELATEALNQNQ